MYVMTADGWKPLAPRVIIAPGHTRSLLEHMGITMEYDGIAAMADYANAPGRGVYFTYTKNGRQYQSKGAVHPLVGMYGEDRDAHE